MNVVGDAGILRLEALRHPQHIAHLDLAAYRVVAGGVEHLHQQATVLARAAQSHAAEAAIRIGAANLVYHRMYRRERVIASYDDVVSAQMATLAAVPARQEHPAAVSVGAAYTSVGAGGVAYLHGLFRGSMAE